MRKLKLLPQVLSLTLCSLAGTALHAADLTLYVDSSTGQIYAEAGPNRVLMGTFRPVEEAVPAAAAAAPAPAQVTALETRVVESEQKIASLEARNADNTRSPFTNRFQVRGYLQTRYTSMLGGDEG